MNNLALTLQELRSEITTAKRELAERRHYLVEQEKLIAIALDNGNSAIRSLGYQVEALEETKRIIATEVYQLTQDKNILMNELLIIQERLSI